MGLMNWSKAAHSTGWHPCNATLSPLKGLGEQERSPGTGRRQILHLALEEAKSTTRGTQASQPNFGPWDLSGLTPLSMTPWVRSHQVHGWHQTGGTSQYTGGQVRHPERPGQAGGMGQQASPEIQQGQMPHPALGKEESPARTQLGLIWAWAGCAP